MILEEERKRRLTSPFYFSERPVFWTKRFLPALEASIIFTKDIQDDKANEAAQFGRKSK